MTTSGQKPLMNRIASALDELRRRATLWERAQPDQRVAAWVEFFLPNGERTYLFVAWDTGLTLELIMLPEDQLDEPAERAAELLGLLALGADAELDTMRHATQPRTEVWTFYRCRFGDEVAPAAYAVQAVLTEAYGADTADRVRVEVHAP